MPQADENRMLTFDGVEPELEVRSESKREIAIRFMRWGEIGRTADGLEMFERGAFRDSDPANVVIRMEHEGPPVGMGTSLEEDEVGATLVGKVAPTARGDELLTLAKEGYYKGASVSFEQREGGTRYSTIDRQRVAVRTLATAREVSATWRPTFKGTEVLYARSDTGTAQAPVMEVEPVAENTAADQPVAEAPEPQQRGVELTGAPGAVDYLDFKRRLEELEERTQQPTNVEIPDPAAGKIPYRGEWMKGALTLMDGGQLLPIEQRTLADIISSDNPAFVPTAYSNELIGIIDAYRGFIGSTRRLDMPAEGLEISYPRIVTRPTVGEQETEKTEVTSTTVESDRVTAAVRTFAGAGDLSLQLLRRSSPQFLSAYLELLAEAYADTTDAAAIAALFAAGTTPGSADFDPADPSFGEALTNAVAVGGRRLRPDRIWLSTDGVQAFVDARTAAGGGDVPMYPAMAGIGGVTAGGGGGPLPMTLEPVWVPALDATGVDVMIGPSRGFGWAEEGTFTLQADVPGKLGRDVALAGFMAFLALYPAAFTTYDLGS